MEREILKRYFEQNSTATETKAVEDWLLDPSNKITFEKFLEDEWNEHVQQTDSNIVHMKKYQSGILWRAASVAVVLLAAFGLYKLIPVQPKPYLSANVQHATAPAAVSSTTSSDSQPLTVSDTVKKTQPKTVHHEQKRKPLQPEAVIAQADIPEQEIKPKSVPSSKMSNFMVNEVALAKLAERLDTTQLVFDVNMSEVTIQRLAYLLRKQYGIVLELCSTTDTNRTYSASFEKISIHDLLNDMSEKMLFSYTFQENKVKICFN
ncbi:hypothetical protein [Sphingobacterium sp. LRF_L2]|uniref:hypothetical protein n=1 Tax=Sphingobacterium sp. LRF_L2 TaxID=3369421 RepID=UPI003F6424D6